MFIDNMKPKIVDVATGEYTTSEGNTIKCVIPVSGSATFKAGRVSPDHDDHAVGGLYANAGLTRLPGEFCYGTWSKITVTSGTVICYEYKYRETF